MRGALTGLSLEPTAWLTAATTHGGRARALLSRRARRRCRATRTCTSHWACCTAWRGTTARPRTRSAPRSPRARTTTASGTSWARRWPTAGAGARLAPARRQGACRWAGSGRGRAPRRGTAGGEHVVRPTAGAGARSGRGRCRGACRSGRPRLRPAAVAGTADTSVPPHCGGGGSSTLCKEAQCWLLRRLICRRVIAAGSGARWSSIGPNFINPAVAGRSGEAVGAYQRALDLKPNYMRAWANMGISQARAPRAPPDRARRRALGARWARSSAHAPDPPAALERALHGPQLCHWLACASGRCPAARAGLGTCGGGAALRARWLG